MDRGKEYGIETMHDSVKEILNSNFYEETTIGFTKGRMLIRRIEQYNFNNQTVYINPEHVS